MSLCVCVCLCVSYLQVSFPRPGPLISFSEMVEYTQHLAHKEGKGVIKEHESSKGICSGVLRHWQGLGFRV